MPKRSAMRALISTFVAVVLAAAVVGAASAGDGDHHKKGSGDAAATTATTSTTSTAAPTATTVASGLDNPRDLAFGPDGQLYLAQAGHGGPFCAPGGGPEGGQ